MGQRLALHDILKVILGSNHVYFQPPSTVNLEYPCIVYRRSGIDTAFADNNPYLTNKRYQITIIDPNPDSLIPDKIGKLPTCAFERHYTADNLNHDVYNIFY
jgi:hypothetical protein